MRIFKMKNFKQFLICCMVIMMNQAEGMQIHHLVSPERNLYLCGRTNTALVLYVFFQIANRSLV